MGHVGHGGLADGRHLFNANTALGAGLADTAITATFQTGLGKILHIFKRDAGAGLGRFDLVDIHAQFARQTAHVRGGGNSFGKAGSVALQSDRLYLRSELCDRCRSFGFRFRFCNGFRHGSRFTCLDGEGQLADFDRIALRHVNGADGSGCGRRDFHARLARFDFE